MKYLAAIIAFCLGCVAAVAMGATPNFVMRGNFPPEFIAKAEQHAEHCRKVLAVEWLGAELPAWSKPCTVELVPTTNSGGGSTFYGFDGSKAFDFEGKWSGPEERLLNDVIPHEVLHTVLASKFGQVPRWADEGAAMNAEFTDTANKLFEAHLHQKLYRPNDGGFPTDQLLRFTEYPKDFQTFYAQSYSLSRFLIQHGGKRGFVAFLEQALSVNDYEPALKDHFGLTEATLQTAWLSWYQAGCPLSPDQLGTRSVSYAGGNCRFIWTQNGWVQACDQPQYQAQVRPAQPTNPAPLQPIPPKPQQPAKPCTCDNAALISRITKLEAELVRLQGLAVPGPPGPKGDKGDTGPQGTPGKDAALNIEELAGKLPPITFEAYDGDELLKTKVVPLGGTLKLQRYLISGDTQPANASPVK